MKLVSLLFLFIPVISMAAPAELSIQNSGQFFAAAQNHFIQAGAVVEISNLDVTQPMCSTSGYNTTDKKLTGDLSFSRNTTTTGTEYVADFLHQAPTGFVSFHCTGAQPLGIAEVNQILGAIASLR
jgi:hypothetical protein